MVRRCMTEGSCDVSCSDSVSDRRPHTGVQQMHWCWVHAVSMAGAVNAHPHRHVLGGGQAAGPPRCGSLRHRRQGR
jgi:hypothetical protein